MLNPELNEVPVDPPPFRLVRSQQLGLQTIAEASACGLFFAIWWRTAHVAEKARYDKYYATVRMLSWVGVGGAWFPPWRAARAAR